MAIRTIPPLLADGGDMTIMRHVASHAYGTLTVTYPDGVNTPEDNDLNQAYTYQLRDENTPPFGRAFIRADLDIDAENNTSTVEEILDDITNRTAGEALFQTDITRAGLGRLELGVDFNVGDLVPVRRWGRILDNQLITAADDLSSPGDPFGCRVHVGGQLIREPSALAKGNRDVARQIAQERKERLAQVKAVDKKAEDAKFTAETAQGTADTAKQIAEQSKEASDAALTGTGIEYAVGTSEEVPPVSGWSTSTPQRLSGAFIWMRTRITYGSGQSEVTSPVLVTGNTGAPGADGTDGTAGKDGLGIQSTVVLYAVGPSGTVAPASGWSDQVPPLTKGQYLWTRTVWTYTDNSTETGHSVSYIAQDGNDGDDGLPGKDGVGIASTVNLYAVSSSGTVPPTSGWGATPPAAQAGQFMWTRHIWTYTDGTTETGHTIGKIGNTGAKGDKGEPGSKGADGLPGKDGVGLDETVVEYALATSGTITPPTGWSTTVPTLIKGRYLWTRTTWTYTDNSTETGHSVSYIPTDGSDGEDGLPGKDGVGITGTTITYAKSSSGTTAPTTGWSSQPPVTSPGDYVWTRTVWSYSDGTTETGYSVGRIGLKGDPGSAGKGISSTATAYASSASGTTTPTAGWTTSIPVVPKGHFLWTRTTLTFTDGATSVSYAVSRQGVDGENGTPGNPGADGKTSYFHTAYANSADGVAGFSTTDPTGRTYVGTYSDFTEADSTDPSRYTWQLVKGTDGAPGKGVDTVTITYASSSSGTQAPTTGWQTTMPTVPQGHFLWTRTLTRFTDGATTTVDMVARQGVDGEKGTPGVPGHDGRTPFLHVAYANSADGTVDFSTTDPAGRSYLGTYTDYATLDIYSDVYADSYGTSTPLDSTDPARYSWALIKGTDGVDGVDGADGADGVSVAGMTIYYRLVPRDSPPPPRPTVAQPSGWTTTEPDYQSGTTLYQVIKVTYSNGAFAYTDVSRVSAYMAAASAMEVAEDGVERAKSINQALTGSIDGDLAAAMADSGTAIGAVADAATTARDWTVENQQDFNNTVALANAAQAKVNDVNLINWETQAERNALQTEIDEAQNVALRLQENAIQWSSILAVRQVSSPNLVLYPHLNFNDYGWVIITKTNLGQVWVSPKDAWAGTMTVHYVNEFGQSVIHRYTRTDPNSIPPDWGLSESQASGKIRDVHVILTPWRWRDPRQFVFPYSRGGAAFDPVATYDEIPYGPSRKSDSSYTFGFAVRADRPVRLSPDGGKTWYQVPAGSEITAGDRVLPVSYTDGPARRVITFTEVSTG